MIPHEDHIWELAEEIGATVRWVRSNKFKRRYDGSHHGSSNGHGREIALGWQASGEDAYWTALHELGHQALGHSGLPDNPKGTAGEADAWAWALERTRMAPSPVMYSRIREALRTYVDKRGDHPRVEEVLTAIWRAVKVP